MGKNQRTQRTQAIYKERARQESGENIKAKEYWPTSSEIVKQTLNQVNKVLNEPIAEEPADTITGNTIAAEVIEESVKEPKKKGVSSASKRQRGRNFSDVELEQE